MATKQKEQSDAALIRLYQETGDNAYVGELYKRYSMLVYGLCYNYLKHEEEAKDAVAEIFILVMDKLKTHEVSYFKSWLYTLSKNYLIRKKEKNNLLETTDIEKISGKFMENEGDLSLNRQEDESQLLQQAISNLPEEQRTCLELFYYQQKPYQEVASMTGYDLNKVKSAIQNGKRNLKIFMEENKRKHG